MEEKILVKGKLIERKILAAYCFGIPAAFFIFTLLYGNTCPDFDNWSWLLYVSLGVIVIGIFLWFLLANCDITVTDKRVYGKAAFGVMTDLPFDKISSVGTGFPKAVSVATSSGLIRFFMLENQQEVFTAISEHLMKRQSQTTDTNSNSIADELKKYKELLDIGAISQDEYDAKKKELL